jgi:translocation and assembly module TamA
MSLVRPGPRRGARAWLLAGLVIALLGVVARAADPQPYSVAIRKTGDAELDKAVSDASLLVSLREKAPVDPFALIARARDDEQRFLSVLYGLGFYDGQVSIRIGGHALDDPSLTDYLTGLPAQPPVPVTVSIQRGPLFSLGTVTIEGSLPEAAQKELQLAPGAPAVAAEVLAARVRLLNALRDEGYALATVSEPVAILDPSAQTLDISFQVDTGPRVDIGPISFKGLEGVNASFLRRRMLLHPGERYDPTAIDAARQDLASLGVFTSVVAIVGKQLDPQGQLPVEFVVSERKRHAVSLSAEYSTDLGASVGASWLNRNLFGNAEQLKLGLGFSAGGTAQSGPGYWGSLRYIKPDFLHRDQSLQIDFSPLKESLSAYDRTAVTGSVALNRKFSDRWTGSIGVWAERERVTQQSVSERYSLIGLPIVAKYDGANDLLDPTRGVRASLSVTPTQVVGGHNGSFVALEASASTYLDVGALVGAESGRSILALRGLVGDLEGASQLDVPPDKRFYAGGSATVRGYKYQTVGPVFPDKQPQGGTAVIAGTIELRQRIGKKFGAAAFVDVGQVAANGWSFDGPWGIGAGIGGRYYTAIGPIRVDLAIPVNKLPDSGSFQIYIGIGQAF